MKSLFVLVPLLIVFFVFAIPRPGSDHPSGMEAGSATVELVRGGTDASGTPNEAFFFYSGGIDRLLVDPRDAGLVQCLGMLDERLLELERDLDARDFPADLVRFLAGLCAQPFSFRLGPDDGGMHLELAVECESDADAAALSKSFMRFAREARLPVRRGPDNQSFFSTPLGEIRVGVAAGDLRLTLGDVPPSGFDPTRVGLPHAAPAALFVRYDGVRMGELIEHVMGRSDGSLSGALYALGMAGLLGENAGVHSLALGSTSDRGVFVARSEVPGMGAVAPLDLSIFELVPASATVASVFTAQPGSFLGQVDAVTDGAGTEALGMLQMMSGVDLQTALLEKIGPAAGAYWSTSTGGGGWMSSVFFIEARDTEAVDRALGQLLDFAEAMAAEGLDGRVSQRFFTHDGVTCRTLAFPGLPVPLEVSFAVANGFLYATLSPTALMEALEQRAGRPDLLQHSRLAALDTTQLEEATHFTFVDTPYFVQRGHGAATFVAAGLANAVRSPYDPSREPGVLVPRLGELLSNAQAFVSHGRVDPSGSVTTGTFDRSFVAQSTAIAGSPISRSYATVAGLAMVSSISIPNLLSARTSANENAAIATLRSVTSAQAQFQAGAVLDEDYDGAGEYGTFGEMSGAVPLRGRDQAADARSRVLGTLDPPVLSTAFGNLLEDGTGHAVVLRSGYYFQMWLPGNEQGGRVPGVAESVNGVTETVDADMAEILWCCYAWPEDPGRTGQRAFFVNQYGDVLSTTNDRTRYGGLSATGGTTPSFDAAFQRAGDLSSEPALPGSASQDGNVWAPMY